VSSRPSKTNPRGTIALICALAMALVLACCGSSGPSRRQLLGQSLMNDAFASHAAIERANLLFTLSFKPVGPGSSSAGGVEVDMKGPFENEGPGKLPRFALTAGVLAGGHTIQVSFTATGSQLFVKLGNSWFLAPEETYKAIEQGYAQATGSEQSRSTFSTLGVDPRKWTVKPTYANIVWFEGENDYYVSAGVNTVALQRDVARFTQSVGQLGSAVPVIAALTPTARAIKSARVEIYTGKRDHLLRSLELFARMSATPQTRALMGGAGEAKVELTIVFNKVNEPQVITAPLHAKPFSQMLPVLQQFLGNLHGAVATGG
jgi:hypothetical protein